MKNISRALGLLLGVDDWTTLAQFQDSWNQHAKAEGLSLVEMEERVSMHRAQLSDETVQREQAQLRLADGYTAIAISVEGKHHMATVTHTTLNAEWLPHCRHAALRSWSDVTTSGSVVQSLFPALLADQMLSHLPPHRSHQQLLQALLSMRWGADRLLWSPLDDHTNEFNNSMAAEEKATSLLAYT